MTYKKISSEALTKLNKPFKEVYMTKTNLERVKRLSFIGVTLFSLIFSDEASSLDDDEAKRGITQLQKDAAGNTMRELGEEVILQGAQYVNQIYDQDFEEYAHRKYEGARNNLLKWIKRIDFFIDLGGNITKWSIRRFIPIHSLKNKLLIKTRSIVNILKEKNNNVLKEADEEAEKENI